MVRIHPGEHGKEKYYRTSKSIFWIQKEKNQQKKLAGCF